MVDLPETAGLMNPLQFSHHEPNQADWGTVRDLEINLLNRWGNIKQIMILDLRDNRIKAAKPIFDEDGAPVENKVALEVRNNGCVKESEGRTLIIHINGGANRSDVEQTLKASYKED